MIIIKNLRFSKPQFAWQVRVDRASVLGNPYYMENETQRDKVCGLYKAYFEENMQDTNSAFYQEMKDTFTIFENFKLLSVSHGLTGKMASMPAITSSMLCNENCQKLMQVKGSVCEKCYTKKYLSSRPSVDICYRENSDLLSSSIIPKNQLPFVNAAYCRLETFGDIINATHL